LVFLPLVNVWDRRSIIFDFTLMNIKMRFKNTYLGILWAALEPLLYFSVLYIVFSTIRIGRQEDFAIYLITGVVFFHIFVRGTSGGLGSLTSNSGILKSLRFNREFFPVVATLAVAILGLVDLLVFFSLMPLFGFIPSWTLVLLPIPLLLLLVLILGLSYLLSIANVYAKDIQHLWSIFVHALLFASPIFWYLENVEGVLLEIQKINPLGQLIEIAHNLVIFNQIPPLEDWLYTTSIIFGIFIFGYFVFRRYESKAIEEL